MIYELTHLIDNDNGGPSFLQMLPAGLNGPVKTKPIVSSGKIYCGSSVETILDWTSYIEQYVFANDCFTFYDRSEPLYVNKRTVENQAGMRMTTKGIIQPSLWISNGQINAFFRSSTGLGKIYHSKIYEEEIYEELWTSPKPTKLSNPNSGIDTIYANDKLYLIYNPSESERDPLHIAELDDNFNIVDTLEIEKLSELGPFTDGCLTRELSYPYAVCDDENIHLVYTYGRSKIKYCKIQL